MNYYGNQFSGGALYHFKYIKRVKGPDGKYRYYYADQATHRHISGSMAKARNYKSQHDQYLRSYQNHMGNAKYYSSVAKDLKTIGRGTVAVDNLSSDEYRKAQSDRVELSKSAKKAQDLVDFMEDRTVSAQAKAAYNKARETGKRFLAKYFSRR